MEGSIRIFYKRDNQQTRNKLQKSRLLLLPVIAAFVFSTVSPQVASANSYDQKIQRLNQQNSQSQAAQSSLEAKEETLSQKLKRLEAEINGLEKQISTNRTKNRQVRKRIKVVERKIAKQKNLLEFSLRMMYIDGDISAIEMLASSQNLSEYLDKEQYRLMIQESINNAMAEIAQLKNELNDQKTRLDKLISDQTAMQKRLNKQRAEQSRLLKLNRSQQADYDNKIQANNSKIAELRRQQAAENARLAAAAARRSSSSSSSSSSNSSSSSSGRSYTAGRGVNCGGDYPGSASGPWGNWGCNYPIDNAVDSWGMYNRQCVSYTAFKVASSGRHMPYWGGRGNAKLWDNNARAAGIPVDYNPRAGDVAISNSGYYGHAMYVERVAGDGSIYVSDYNQQWDGRYREYWIDGSTVRVRGLVFIHF